MSDLPDSAKPNDKTEESDDETQSSEDDGQALVPIERIALFRHTVDKKVKACVVRAKMQSIGQNHHT
jgi:hypothetical protein